MGTFEGFDYTTPTKPMVRQINFTVTAGPGDIVLTEHDVFRWITVKEIPDLQTNATMQTCLEKAFESIARADAT